MEVTSHGRKNAPRCGSHLTAEMIKQLAMGDGDAAKYGVSEHPPELEAGTASPCLHGVWKMNRVKMMVDSGNRWRMDLMCCGVAGEKERS